MEDISPLPFQEPLIERFSKASGLIWADMGTGKTFTSIWAAQRSGAKTIMVVAPAAMTGVWQGEILRLEPDAEIQTATSKRLPVPGVRWAIATYDSVTRSGPLVHALRMLDADFFILDEAHYLKSSKARRTQIWLDLAKGRHTVALSGTPMPNHIGELWTLLHHFDATYMSEAAFLETFCTWKLMKAGGNQRAIRVPKGTNLARAGQIRTMLEPVAARVKKADVLPQLPTKSRRIVDVPHTKLDAAALKAFEVTPDGLRMQEAIANGRLDALEPTVLARYQSLLAATKARHAADYAMELLDEGAPAVVLWFIHRTAMNVAEARLAECDRKLVRIDGSTQPSHRKRAVDLFQSGTGFDIALLQVKAAGVGLTLTRAHNSVHAEYSWSPADNLQAEDRIHRIGQVHPCTYDYLAVSGTIDRVLLAVLARKQAELSTIDT